VLPTSSWFRPLSADATKMDGLNIHFAAVDEVHEHPGPEIIQKLNTATGARRQPLIFEITTAGYDRHSVCRQHHEFSVKALEGTVPTESSDSWFAYIATIDEGDDWTDEKVWVKANPSLGVTVKRDDLKRQIDEAKEMPAQQNAIRRLRLNEWTEQVTRWLDMSVWEEGGLGNSTVSTDVLGDPYEYLGGKFADVTRRNKAGEFYTPRSVVRMMVEILDPQESESIYDPACGTGGMLLGAIEHVMRKGGDPRTFYGKIYGQEKNLTTAAIARMNLVLHGIEDFQVAREDTLRNPAFTDSSTGGLATFDCVIANPPFSLKEWGRDLWEADPWGRAQYGIPPESYGDYAFVQHMIASMAPTGNSRMAVVLPQGALFRKSAEGSIRQALLEKDMVEAVIGLAPNLFYGTQLAGCVVILRRKKPEARKNKVLIIDASSLFRKGRAQNFLDQEHSDQIVGWYRAFEDVEDRAKVATLDEIKKEGWTLNISRYVLPPIGQDIPPLPEAVDAFKTALADARAAEDHLRKVLVEGGWLQ